MLQVLLVAAVVSLIIGVLQEGLAKLVDGVAIFSAVFLVVIISSVINYRNDIGGTYSIHPISDTS
jgi:hypothetical protein